MSTLKNRVSLTLFFQISVFLRMKSCISSGYHKKNTTDQVALQNSKECCGDSFHK